MGFGSAEYPTVLRTQYAERVGGVKTGAAPAEPMLRGATMLAPDALARPVAPGRDFGAISSLHPNSGFGFCRAETAPKSCSLVDDGLGGPSYNSFG
jgi:hypothetical protein